MSLNLENVGWTEELEWGNDDSLTGKLSGRPNKVVLPAADGSFIVLVPDHNAVAAASGFGDQTGNERIDIFSIPSGFGSATQIASVNVGPFRASMDHFSADMYSDGDIALVYWRKDTSAVCYRRIQSGGSVGAEEVIQVLNAADTCLGLDVSVSEADIVAFSALLKKDTDPKLRCRAWVRHSSGWASASQIGDIITSANPKGLYCNTSLTFLRGGTAAARPIMLAIDAANSSNDLGSRIYTGVVNETTGALTNPQLRKTYLSGDIKTNFSAIPRRSYIFSAGVGEAIIAYMQAADNKKLLMARHTFDGTVWAEAMPAQTTQLTFTPTLMGKFAASFAQDTVNFYFIQRFGGNDVAVNVIGILDRTENTVRWSGPFRWDNSDASPDRFLPMAGTGRYSYLAAKHSMVYYNRADKTKWQARAHRNLTPTAPYEVQPSGGGVFTGTPPLSAKVSLQVNFPQSKHKLVWQFATDSGFTTNIKTYTQPDSKFVKMENTAAAGAFYFVQDTLPPALGVSSGTWYVRAAVIDEFRQQGDWSAAGSITLSHPPAATNLIPNGAVLSDTAVQFKWTFTDPLSTDTQTAYQVIVERVDTGAVILDTGQVNTVSTSTIRDLGAGALGLALRWKVRVWDTDGTAGAYSSYATFSIGGAPGVSIDAPTPGSVVPTGTPQVLFTPTTDGGRAVKAYVVNLFVGGEVERTSGSVPVDSPSGVQLAYRFERPLLEPGVNYSVQVSATDETGLVGTSAEVAFTVDYDAPPGSSSLVVDVSHFGIEGEGWVQLDWDDSGRDPNFFAWIIERKDDMIDLAGSVVEEGEWAEVAEVTGVTPSFKDFFAPSGYKSTYRVRQLINSGGSYSISEGDQEVASFPMSEGYWIIEPALGEDNTTAFRLSIVIADDYTDEWEETEYNVIGRGRHVDRGDHLGVNGSLTAQLRDSAYATARIKKRRLEAARDRESVLYLRNPFGDVHQVNVGNVTVSRIAGVGTAEFCDVTVPYVQVSL